MGLPADGVRGMVVFVALALRRVAIKGISR